MTAKTTIYPLCLPVSIRSEAEKLAAAIAKLQEVHARTHPAGRMPEPPPTAPPEAEG